MFFVSIISVGPTILKAVRESWQMGNEPSVSHI